jgi:hypothetical protein
MKYSLWLVAALFAFTKTAFADDITTVYVDLNWAAVQFSGPVLPIAPLPGDFPTQTGAVGVNLTTNEVTRTTSEPAGWGTSTSKVQFGPRDYAQSSTDGLLTAFSSITGNYVLDGGLQRTGLIKSVDGTISIAIPYSFSVVTTPGFAAQPRFLIFLFSPDGNLIRDVEIVQTYEGNGIEISNSGILSASASNLQTDTYYGFDIEESAETVHTDEPSTSLLLTTSFVCLGCLFWKRLARDGALGVLGIFPSRINSERK